MLLVFQDPIELTLLVRLLASLAWLDVVVTDEMTTDKQGQSRGFIPAINPTGPLQALKISTIVSVNPEVICRRRIRENNRSTVDTAARCLWL